MGGHHLPDTTQGTGRTEVKTGSPSTGLAAKSVLVVMVGCGRLHDFTYGIKFLDHTHAHMHTHTHEHI